VFATLVITFLSATGVAETQPGNGRFCLRSTDAAGRQVCFPMQQPAGPSSEEEQTKLRAELQRRAAEAIERLRARQQDPRPAP
jgi:hypothetical protein